MRYLLSVMLLFSLHLFVNGQTGKTIFNSQKTFTIDGKIINYIPNDSNGFISFRTYSIDGRSKDTAFAINRNGNFKITLFQPFAGDIGFIYYDDYTEIYASPGEYITLTIDENKWKTHSNLGKAMKVTGPSSLISMQMWPFREFKDAHPLEINPDNEEDKITEPEYVKQKQIEMKAELERLQKYAKEYKAPEAFITWAKNDIIYYSAFSTCFTLLSSKRDFNRHDSTLVNYFRNIPLNSSTAIHNSKYYMYMEMITGGLEITVNVNSIYEKEKKENGLNAMPLYMRLIEKYGSGRAKDLMFYNIATGASLPRIEPYKNAIEKKITDSYIRNEYLKSLNSKEKPFQSFNIIAKIKAQSKDSLIIKRLLDILDKYKDRYVFIDFWGSWCAPCMGEMPHYPELMTQVNDLPVSFLFMSADTPQEKVDKMKESFPADAEFINLSSNETKILNNAFGFHSYPSHFLLAPGSITANMKLGGILSGDVLGAHAQKRIREAVVSK